VKRFGAIAAGVGLGLLAGPVFFLIWFRFLPPSSVANGPWRANPTIGVDAASPLDRTRTAMTILAAVPQSEFTYFFANRDDSGDSLTTRCAYRIVGGRPDAAFWSLTAYDRGGFLTSNVVDRFSVNQNDMRGDDIRVEIARTGDGSNWLPTPRGNQFNLVLRLYEPSAKIVTAPEKADLPSIQRVGCA